MNRFLCASIAVLIFTVFAPTADAIITTDWCNGTHADSGCWVGAHIDYWTGGLHLTDESTEHVRTGHAASGLQWGGSYTISMNADTINFFGWYKLTSGGSGIAANHSYPDPATGGTHDWNSVND
jgi:hypothetical protein